MEPLKVCILDAIILFFMDEVGFYEAEAYTSVQLPLSRNQSVQVDTERDAKKVSEL